MQCCDDRGYAMAALLVGMSVMAIMLSVALPVWRTAVQREREAELIFRGEQYAHAIELFSRRTGGFPPSLEVLEKGRFIRKLYKDPMTEDGQFQPVYLGQLLPGQMSPPGTTGGRGVGAAAGVPSGPSDQSRGVTRGGQGLAQPAAGQAQGSPRAGQPNAIGAGPIIGVVSKSTAASLRLYNGRGRYSDWAFVATAATQQPTAPAGAQQTPGRGPLPGRGRGRGLILPGRGPVPPVPPGRGMPPGTPFGSPTGFPPTGQGQRGPF